MDTIKERVHDRIWEAYHGELGAPFMRDTKKRIHWICGMVNGKRVLDIGCSSGIVPILLAREGATVVGVDSDATSIDEAKTHLTAEAGFVQERVEFLEADFLTFDPEQYKPFDTIVMTEVLEHLVRPADMIAKAAQFLMPGGKVIVTVPFGINDFFDHKQTFYLTEPYNLIAKFFEINSVELLGKWIGFVATKPTKGSVSERTSIPNEEVASLEEAFFSLERSIRDSLTSHKTKISALENNEKLASDARKELQNEIDELQSSLKNLEEREILLVEAKNELHNANVELSQIRALLQERERQLLQSEIQLEAITVQLDDLREAFAVKEAELLAETHNRLQEVQSESSANGQDLEKKYKRMMEKLETSSLKTKQLTAVVGRLEYQKKVAEKRAEDVKKTLSFQLGHALIQATKSWRGFTSFPSEAFRIHKESRRRKDGKLTKSTPKKINLDLAAAPRKRCLLKAPVGRRLRIAGVMDEFTFHSYEPECELLQLHPENWKQQLEHFKPDILFIESAWKGLDGLWQTKISNADPEIIAAIAWCRTATVPTLFWNKEDPVHFGTFIPIAKEVDYVFTTDIDCVPKYKYHVGHNDVYLLPFAAQPSTHNPIELYSRRNAFNFAGSYYLRYPERQRDFTALIDTVQKFHPVEIYDRNFDSPHPHYTFPEEYVPMIIGKLPFAEIDRAYKGYRYGINMNTIKQSQTMFARRVFELLASNTVVISNFSRGVRLLFGDLIVASDDGEHLTKRLELISESDTAYRKLRLLGLRKVMSDHTYAHRLTYICERMGAQPTPNPPPVVIISVAHSGEDVAQLKANFERQKHPHKRLLVVGASVEGSQQDIEIFATPEACVEVIRQLPSDTLVGVMHPADYYGSHYLTDLYLASTYSSADAFGKLSRYSAVGETLEFRDEDRQYQATSSLLARGALSRLSALSPEWFAESFKTPGEAIFSSQNMLATDEFHYIANGFRLAAPRHEEVEDLTLADQGVAFSDLQKQTAEGAGAAKGAGKDDQVRLPQVDARGLLKLFPQSDGVNLSLKGQRLHVSSSLPAGKHIYIYARKKFSREELNFVLNSQIELSCDCNVQMKTVFEFQDDEGRKISHQMNNAGSKHSLAIPPNCRLVRFGLRIEGPGQAVIDKLILGSQRERPAAILCRSPYLVLTKQYPSYNDLYRYGFLHSRVRAYKEAGLMVDVFRLSRNASGYEEFEGIDIATGDAELLDATLATGQIKHVLVHLMDEKMWEVLRRHIDKVRVTVWVHGAEIQVWQRREFEFERLNEEEIWRQKKLSDRRRTFWSGVLTAPHPNIHFVIVSQAFADEVLGDLEMDLPKDKYSIIHNYVDEGVFPYVEKSPSMRKKVLSIRPFASRKYANDLSVRAILELSSRECFKEMEFCIVGDGDLFDTLVEPLRAFENVRLEQRFLRHHEVSAFHKEFGVFLTPTRMDAQGLSRDEAMSGGLVPVTTRIAAVPEFVDNECGRMVAPEDYLGLANAMEELVNDEELFKNLSVAAAKRVRWQSGYNATIQREIQLVIDGCDKHLDIVVE